MLSEFELLMPNDASCPIRELRYEVAVTFFQVFVVFPTNVPTRFEPSNGLFEYFTPVSVQDVSLIP